jgi:uncharacterized membrane protein YbhN (UPF0104 family)
VAETAPSIAAAHVRRRAWLYVLAALAAVGAGLAALVAFVDPVRDVGFPLALADTSVDQFLAAAHALGRRLADVAPGALAAALALSALNVALRSVAWRNIVGAAYPGRRPAWRHTFAATYAGIGANAVLPARIGDPLRLLLVRRKVHGSTFPTLASTLIAETAFDAAAGGCLLVWAWQARLLPAAPSLSHLPLFELAWYARHPWILAVVGGVAVAVVLVAQRHVRAFWERVKQGLVILTEPARYVREVATYQAVGWVCRVAAAYFFLDAFGVEATLRNALLVQVASSLATLVPATPGGLGPRQALYVLLLSGAASTDALLAFGIGTGLSLSIWNAAVGFACLAATLRGTSLRSALRHARQRSQA